MMDFFGAQRQTQAEALAALLNGQPSAHLVNVRFTAACAAMQGILARSLQMARGSCIHPQAAQAEVNQTQPLTVAREAVDCADALLAELAKKGTA